MILAVRPAGLSVPVFIAFWLAGHWVRAVRHVLVPDEAMIHAANKDGHRG